MKAMLCLVTAIVLCACSVYAKTKALDRSTFVRDFYAAYTAKERAVAPVSDQEMYQQWLQRAPVQAVVGSSATPGEIAAVTGQQASVEPRIPRFAGRVGDEQTGVTGGALQRIFFASLVLRAIFPPDT